MRILLIADPADAEHVADALCALPGDNDVSIYAGGNLGKRRYELLCVAAHVTRRGVLLGGDAWLSPLVMGDLAVRLRVQAVWIASCDGAGVALEVAQQAKAAAVIFYPAALDPGTAQRMAAGFVERLYNDGLHDAVEQARAADYHVLNPLFREVGREQMTDNGGGVGNSDRALLEITRTLATLTSEVSYVRRDVDEVKNRVKGIEEAQTTAAFKAAQNTGMPLRNAATLVLFVMAVSVLVAWLVIYLGNAGVNG